MIRICTPRCTTVRYSALQCAKDLSKVHCGDYVALQCATVCHGALRCATVRHGALWSSTVRYGALRRAVMRYEAVRCATVHYGELR